MTTHRLRNTETKAINKTDDSDNLQIISKQKLNPNNVDILNTNNNGLFKNINYFDKMNIKELEPTTQILMKPYLKRI